MWKRISAALFDSIVLGMLAVGFAWLLSFAMRYQTYQSSLEEFYAQYEAAYGVHFEVSEETYLALSEEERAAYDAAYQALVHDGEAMRTYRMVMSMTLVMISCGVLLAFVLWELVLPSVFGHGRTLGKKIFGLALMRTDGVKISGIQLFVRTILGKYTVETMLPILIILLIYFNYLGAAGTVFICLLGLLQLILLCATSTRSPIHDLLAATVVVDMASQLIFDSPEALLEAKKQEAAEAANRRPY